MNTRSTIVTQGFSIDRSPHMNNNKIMGLEIITRKRYQTVGMAWQEGLTPVTQPGILVAELRNDPTKESHGNGGTENSLSVAWLDTRYTHTKPENKICVCSQEERGESPKSIFCSLAQDRADERNGSASQASNHRQQKIKAGFPRQLNNFVAINLLLKAWNPGRNRFSYQRCAYVHYREPCQTLSRCYTTLYIHRHAE